MRMNCETNIKKSYQYNFDLKKIVYMQKSFSYHLQKQSKQKQSKQVEIL